MKNILPRRLARKRIRRFVPKNRQWIGNALQSGPGDVQWHEIRKRMKDIRFIMTIRALRKKAGRGAEEYEGLKDPEQLTTLLGRRQDYVTGLKLLHVYADPADPEQEKRVLRQLGRKMESRKKRPSWQLLLTRVTCQSCPGL